MNYLCGAKKIKALAGSLAILSIMNLSQNIYGTGHPVTLTENKFVRVPVDVHQVHKNNLKACTNIYGASYADYMVDNRWQGPKNFDDYMLKYETCYADYIANHGYEEAKKKAYKDYKVLNSIRRKMEGDLDSATEGFMFGAIRKELKKCCNSKNVQNLFSKVLERDNLNQDEKTLRNLLNECPFSFDISDSYTSPFDFEPAYGEVLDAQFDFKAPGIGFEDIYIRNFLRHSSSHFMSDDKDADSRGRPNASRTVLALKGRNINYYYALHLLNSKEATVYDWKSAETWKDAAGNTHTNLGRIDIVIPRYGAKKVRGKWVLPSNQSIVENFTRKYKARKAKIRGKKVWIVPAQQCEENGKLTDTNILKCGAKKDRWRRQDVWAIPINQKTDIGATYAHKGDAYATEKIENFPALLIRFLLVNNGAYGKQWIPASMYAVNPNM